MKPKRSRKAAKGVARTFVPLLPSLVKLLGGLLRDARVPLLDKGLLVAVILYVVSPLDLVPDFLGILGLSDDLFLLAVVLRRLLLGAGDAVVASHWSGSRRELDRLMGAVEDLGALVPGPIRGFLESLGSR